MELMDVTAFFILRVSCSGGSVQICDLVLRVKQYIDAVFVLYYYSIHTI